MLGDITIYQQSSAQGGRGSRRFNTAASATLIYAGEPVTMVAGATTVLGAVTNLTTVPSPFVRYTVSARLGLVSWEGR